MCILFWTVDNHHDYKFIFAGNRDEFLSRPTKPAHVWFKNNKEDKFNIIGGTDMEPTASCENGTWLGMTTDGRLAALTNFREVKYEGRRSRGELVRDFLLMDNNQQSTVENYMSHLQQTTSEYGGYSLVCFDLLKNEMAYFSNRDVEPHIQYLSPKHIYGLSNSVLSNPWEKVKQGQEAMKILLKDESLTEKQMIENLFNILRSSEPFNDPTNIGQVMTDFKERIFIPKLNNKELGNNASYATRTSTVILVDRQDNVIFVERDWFECIEDNYQECKVPETRRFIFRLKESHIVNNV
ncbi:NRDE protein-domain-containing protein [Halteromyces radiatus]|uniref:NRDE protein-domain-containing protein n=1 Tax=Halteromyces radiatus TaxID=101107 RepID=UPI00221E97B2|nr:NRDE protein-domain-containing protein [Halteromyces radiatus]KAI8096320.1 NRDE protein-domain-containing protein [Halteromyces radiatus]